ncbi:MAG: glycosyltransferase family 2 protein [Candidatus Hadarchaeota archaeon]
MESKNFSKVTEVGEIKVWIVMPAHNEEKAIGGVLDSLRKEGWRDVIVVDDGSKDKTAKIAESKGATVIRHEKNQGLGAALRTGLSNARELKADIAVTFDSDGQHDTKAVRELVNSADGADLVIGARRFINIPLNKRIGNFGLNFITRMLGGPLVDSQSGMRAFSRRALDSIRIMSDRYVVSSEIAMQAKRKGLRIKEVPVACFFTQYSKARGTTIMSGLRITIELVRLRLAMFRARR